MAPVKKKAAPKKAVAAKKSAMPDHPLLTVGEVAGLLRCSERSVFQMQKDGVLPSLLIANRRLFRREDVDAFVASRVGQ